jgi:hypothetical protein
MVVMEARLEEAVWRIRRGTIKRAWQTTNGAGQRRKEAVILMCPCSGPAVHTRAR